TPKNGLAENETSLLITGAANSQENALPSIADTTTSLKNAPSDGLAEISQSSTIDVQPIVYCQKRSPISPPPKKMKCRGAKMHVKEEKEKRERGFPPLASACFSAAKATDNQPQFAENINACATTNDGFNNKPVDHADVATASTIDNQTEEDDFAHVATTNDALACRVSTVADLSSTTFSNLVDEHDGSLTFKSTNSQEATPKNGLAENETSLLITGAANSQENALPSIADTTTSLKNAPSDGLAEISQSSTIDVQPIVYCQKRSPISPPPKKMKCRGAKMHVKEEKEKRERGFPPLASACFSAAKATDNQPQFAENINACATTNDGILDPNRQRLTDR
ncbi:hypothetical protein As57867_022554, partial [Aphanomyces stellatus]